MILKACGGEIAPVAPWVVARERLVEVLPGASRVDGPGTRGAALQTLVAQQGVSKVEDVKAPRVVTRVLRGYVRPTVGNKWRQRHHL